MMAKFILPYLSALVVLIALTYQSWQTLQPLLLASIFPPHLSGCEDPTYKVRILSYDPLIMHLENFITAKERAHLMRKSKNDFERSTALHLNGSEVVYPGRTSTTALLESSDLTAKCIFERVSEFQGYHAIEEIEPLQLTRYETGQQFENHVDWFPKNHTATLTDGFNRITTFFATLEASCQHCGTRFPNISINWDSEDKKWCNVVECEDTEYLTIKAVPGSAIFWKNLLYTGDGDPRTLHSGLRLDGGIKLGLNIWSRVKVE